MIEYLEQLVEEKKYRDALKQGESLLRSAETPQDLVRIHAATVVSHCMLGEYDAALAGGNSALGLARDIQAWDAFGNLSLWVGIAYGILGQPQESISLLYQYVSYLHHYDKASAHEAYAWYNLGIGQANIGESLEAARSLATSLTAALRRGELRFAHGVRQALIKNHLETGNLESIPRLLAQCAHYLRKYPDAESHKRSWAYHVKFRGEYAIVTGRERRAELLATRALLVADGDRLCAFLMHMLLSVVASKRKQYAQAIEHAVAARTCAMDDRRADLEAEASSLIYQVTRLLAADTQVAQ